MNKDRKRKRERERKEESKQRARMLIYACKAGRDSIVIIQSQS
jgi:hypothetical protein